MNSYRPLDCASLRGRSFDDSSLVDAAGVLTLTLVDELSRQVHLTFQEFIAYRKLDEGDALRAVDEIRDNGIQGMGVFVVENSDFLTWLAAESHHVREAQDMQHFCILTLNSVIDVVAFKEPKIHG